MRTYQSALFIILVVLLTACGGKSKPTSTNETITRAHQILNYTNQVIAESNYVSVWMNNGEVQVFELAEIIASSKPYDINSKDWAAYKTMIRGLTDEARRKAFDLSKVADVLSQEDFSFFQQNTTSYYFQLNQLEQLFLQAETSICDGLNEDVDAGGTLSDALLKSYQEMLLCLRKMTIRAIDLGEEAELLTLEESPMRAVILLMRREMITNRHLLFSFYRYTSSEISKEELALQYANYLVVTTESVKLRGDAKISEAQKSSFMLFIKTSDLLMSSFQQAMNTINQECKSESIDLLTMGKHYDNLVGYYNDVVH